MENTHIGRGECRMRDSMDGGVPFEAAEDFLPKQYFFRY
jgi:hypothetical protein